METYILMAVCLVAWGLTVGAVKLLMPSSENAFVIGALVGLLMAGAAEGAYYTHLSACRACV